MGDQAEQMYANIHSSVTLLTRCITRTPAKEMRITKGFAAWKPFYEVKEKTFKLDVLVTES